MTNWYELDTIAHLTQVKAMDDLRHPQLRPVRRFSLRFGRRHPARSTRVS